MIPALALLTVLGLTPTTTLVHKFPTPIMNKSGLSLLHPILIPVNSVPNFPSKGIFVSLTPYTTQPTKPTQYIQIDDFSFTAQNNLNIGSQSSGAGAGKITFSPVTMVMPGSAASNQFLQASQTGQAFRQVDIYTVTQNGQGAPTVAQKLVLKLVAVKSYSQSTTSSGEISITVNLEAGGVEVDYPSPSAP